MKMFGVNITNKKVEDGWVGYWSYSDEYINLEEVSDVVRCNEYDAEDDAIFLAKDFALINGVQFIADGYTL